MTINLITQVLIMMLLGMSGLLGVEIAAWKKGHYDLGYEISQIDDEIPEILVSDDIDLSVYVTPHVY